jgi:hypothetical protein
MPPSYGGVGFDRRHGIEIIRSHCTAIQSIGLDANFFGAGIQNELPTLLGSADVRPEHYRARAGGVLSQGNANR